MDVLLDGRSRRQFWAAGEIRPVQELYSQSRECPGPSACELAFFRERAQPGTGLHRWAGVLAPGQHHALACNRRAHGVEPHPDRGHRAQVDGDVEVDLEARIDLAEIDALL